MKQCPECGGYFDNEKYKCPDCDKILENTNDIKVKIASRALKVSLGLAPTVYELILCAVLAAEGVSALYFGFWQLTLINFIVASAIFFKGFIYTYFSWDSLLNKIKSKGKVKIYPSAFRIFLQKTALTVWTAVSTLYTISILL